MRISTQNDARTRRQVGHVFDTRVLVCSNTCTLSVLVRSGGQRSELQRREQAAGHVSDVPTPESHQDEFGCVLEHQIAWAAVDDDDQRRLARASARHHKAKPAFPHLQPKAGVVRPPDLPMRPNRALVWRSRTRAILCCYSRPQCACAPARRVARPVERCPRVRLLLRVVANTQKAPPGLSGRGLRSRTYSPLGRRRDQIRE